MFRVGMSKFGGNFRGKEACQLCGLCFSHPDIQEFLASCYVIRNRFKNSTEIIEGIYRETVTDEDARSLVIIPDRDEHIEKDKENI